MRGRERIAPTRPQRITGRTAGRLLILNGKNKARERSPTRAACGDPSLHAGDDTRFAYKALQVLKQIEVLCAIPFPYTDGNVRQGAPDGAIQQMTSMNRQCFTLMKSGFG